MDQLATRKQSREGTALARAGNIWVLLAWTVQSQLFLTLKLGLLLLWFAGPPGGKKNPKELLRYKLCPQEPKELLEETGKTLKEE